MEKMSKKEKFIITAATVVMCFLVVLTILAIIVAGFMYIYSATSIWWAMLWLLFCIAGFVILYFNE